MEMCYDGVLVMPINYAVMDEEEMMYTNGGFDDEIFRNNLRGAYQSYTFVRNALIGGGLTLGAIGKAAFTSAASILTYYGVTINTVAACIGGIVGMIVATVALVAAIDYLGSHRVWY